MSFSKLLDYVLEKTCPQLFVTPAFPTIRDKVWSQLRTSDKPPSENDKFDVQCCHLVSDMACG